jgi:large subunit ribosomal protein L10
LPNQKNVAAVAELEQRFQKSTFALMTDYRGLNVNELANLRRQLRDAGVEYRVSKNTLTLIAANRVGVTGLDRLLTGPTAIAFGSGDEIAAARALSDFARVSRLLALKGGVIGRSILSADDVTALAGLPGRQQLRADLAGAIQGPMASLIGVLNGALSGVVHALEERAKQLEPAT